MLLRLPLPRWQNTHVELPTQLVDILDENLQTSYPGQVVMTACRLVPCAHYILSTFTSTLLGGTPGAEAPNVPPWGGTTGANAPITPLCLQPCVPLPSNVMFPEVTMV